MDLDGPASSALAGVAAAAAAVGAGAGGASKEVLFGSWYPPVVELMLPVLRVLLASGLLAEAALDVLQPLSLPSLEPARSADSVAGMVTCWGRTHSNDDCQLIG